MQVRYSITDADLREEKLRGMGEPPSESLFIRLVFPVVISGANRQIQLSPVPLVRFAIDAIDGLGKLKRLGSGEFVYNDFYGGLSLRFSKRNGLLRVEWPETKEFLDVPEADAIAGFGEFGRAVVQLVEQNFPEAPGIATLKGLV